MSYPNQANRARQIKKEFPSDFKMKLRNAMLNWMFNVRQMRLDDIYMSIMNKHTDRHFTIFDVSRSFIYKAKVYHYPYPKTTNGLMLERADRFRKKLQLDDSSFEAMDNYILESAVLLKGRNQLGTYANSMLAMCNTVADFYLVVPTEMQECFHESMHEANKTSKCSVTEEQLKRFRLNHKQGADYMRQQLLINLLVSRSA